MLMVAFLAEADMHEQLFGHLIAVGYAAIQCLASFVGLTNNGQSVYAVFQHAIVLQALRFGQDKEACLKAIDIGFEQAARPSNTVYKSALKTLQMVSAAIPAELINLDQLFLISASNMSSEDCEQ